MSYKGKGRYIHATQPHSNTCSDPVARLKSVTRYALIGRDTGAQGLSGHISQRDACMVAWRVCGAGLSQILQPLAPVLFSALVMSSSVSCLLVSQACRCPSVPQLCLHGLVFLRRRPCYETTHCNSSQFPFNLVPAFS